MYEYLLILHVYKLFQMENMYTYVPICMILHFKWNKKEIITIWRESQYNKNVC